MALLEVRALARSFYGVHALDSVELDVEAGTITGLIGWNGGGKTTLFHCVSGQATAFSVGDTTSRGSRLAGDRATGAVARSRRALAVREKDERRPGVEPGRLLRYRETVALLRGGLLVVVQFGPVVVHLATVLAALAVVGAEIPAIGMEVAAVTVDVALVVADVLPGAPEVGPVLLHGGHVARRLVLPELLLVLAHGLAIAVAIQPVGAEIPPVLSNIPSVLPQVLAVLAQIALVAPELTAVLLHLRV